jgi:hypothetical protein
MSLHPFTVQATSAPTTPLPDPAASGIEHVVVVMAAHWPYRPVPSESRAHPIKAAHGAEWATLRDLAQAQGWSI